MILSSTSYYPTADMTRSSLPDGEGRLLTMMHANQDGMQAVHGVEHDVIRQMLRREGMHADDGVRGGVDRVRVPRRG